MAIALIKLGLIAAATIVAVLILYQLERKSKAFASMGYMKKQILIGLVFGAFSVLGTECGISINGGIINVRDAAPLCAGLVFGWPSGIIAGCIGGVERWLCVYWDGGEYTRVACTLATIAAGFFAAFIRKYMMEDKKPGWIYALAAGLVTEVLHMLLVFLTNIDGVATAFKVVQVCSPIMITFNTLTVAIAVFLVGLIGYRSEDHKHGKALRKKRKIVQYIQAYLLIAVIITFCLANAFVVVINNSIAMDSTVWNMSTQLRNVYDDIKAATVQGVELEDAIRDATANKTIGETGGVIAFSDEDNSFISCSLNTSYETRMAVIADIATIKKQDMTEIKVGKNDVIVGCCRFSDYFLVGTYPVKEAFFSRNTTVYITAFLLVVVLAVLFIQIYILIRKVVVNNIRRVNEELAKIAAGDLDVVVDVRSNEEFTSLSEDINSTVDTLKHYIKEAENRIDQELQFARDIQSSALSTEYPISRRFELYANMLPARVVGGDFYDFYRLDNDHCVFLVADVSGKGIPAAMFMMKAKTLLKSLVDTGAKVDTVFTKANEELCKGNDADMFVTAWMGILDLTTNTVKFANAGHNRPVVIRKDGHAEYLKSRAGFILAGMEGIKYKEAELKLEPGDVIFLYTDGVTEATNLTEELYGDDRLLEKLKGAQTMDPKAICRYIKQDVDSFVGDAPQFDDITMLAIRIKDADHMASEIFTRPDQDSTAEVQAFIERRVEELDVPMKAAARLGVIVDEIYSNVIKYSQATMARLSLTEEDGRLILKMEDNGIEYDPLKKENPDTSLTAEERDIGGLGIYMVKNMAERVDYKRDKGQNKLRIVIEKGQEIR